MSSAARAFGAVDFQPALSAAFLHRALLERQRDHRTRRHRSRHAAGRALLLALVSGAADPASLRGRAPRRDWPALRRSWRILLVLGSLGGASFNLCLYIGLQTTQAINAGLLQAFIPVTILLLAIPVLRERPSLRQIAGMLVAFTGVIAILFKGDLQKLMQLVFARGDLWIFLGVLLNAGYSVGLKWRPNVHPLSLVVATFGVSSLLLLPLYIAETAGGRPVPMTEAGLGAIVYVAVFPAILAYLCYNRGIELLGASRAGVAIYLVPMMVSLLAVVLLGEPFRLYHAAGMALILGGVAFAESRFGGAGTGKR